jgi:YD repeat-containing protein
VTDAASNVTTYSYDTENNLTSIKDANNHTTSFTYDAFGRVTKTTFPSGYVETYNYDPVGNLSGKTDRKKQSITYTYDQLNRLAQKSYPDTSTVNYDFRRDDPSDKNAKNPSCTDIPGKSCENDAKANRALDRLNFNPLAGYGWGQFDAGTSNDAAAGLLKEAGIGYTLPACAWGKTTGLNPHGPFWWMPPIWF